MNKIFLCFITLVGCALPLSAFAKKNLNESIVQEYLKLQKEFSKQFCTPGTEEIFNTLNKNYRGDGNFIPVLMDDKIDLKTITNLIPLIKEKKLWIQNQIELLGKVENLKDYRFQINRIEQNVNLLQEAKKAYFFTPDIALNKTKRQEIKEKASKQFVQLIKEVDLLKNQIPFLLSFKFPLNHLALRAEYEKFKNTNTKEARSKANSIYLFRKIVQDGSFDEELLHNDSLIRAAFDTLYLSLTKESGREFLTDSERVDFHYVLKNFEKFLNLKPEVLIARLTEWKDRTERSQSFYQELFDGKKIKISEESQIQDVTGLLEARSKSLYTLKDFVLSREAKVYEFWSRRSELLQALYSIETILYNEVGRMDAPDALERRDVAQVVINRFESPEYNRLSNKDVLSKYLSGSIRVSENKWLNVLFKEGEFSFTYFYIPGNFSIYCPDMSKAGQFLRHQNVRIALELLNNSRKNFPALRYFSRNSMFGRIEMDSLWSDFKALPETPGKHVVNPKKLFGQFKGDHYKFLYSFENTELKKTYLVVDLLGKNYVVDASDNKQIYYYRNPHQFKYFTH